MAEAQRPSQKYNEIFVKPMRDMLSNKRKETVHVLSVLTRSKIKGDVEEPLQKAYKEFKEAEKSMLGDPDAHPGQGGLDNDTNTSSDSSEEEWVQSGSEQPTLGSLGVKWLETTEDKAQALRRCHDDPLGGHFGARRTLEKLQRHYGWKGIREDVAQYCWECIPCRRSTLARHRLYGLLAPLPPPTRA